MITLTQYFIGREHTQAQSDNATELLSIVNSLLYRYQTATGTEQPINPHTGSFISGETNGGFRLPDCPIGALNSSHKQAQAIDIYDPDESLDNWVNDYILTEFNLYREHPEYTKGWCHLTTRAPGSGHRTFIP